MESKSNTAAANNERIRALLEDYRRCSTYADRLALFEKYGLSDHLAYPTQKDTIDTHPFQSWAEVGQQSVLSIVPITQQDADEFAVWALRVRRSVVNKQIDVYSPERAEKYVTDKYAGISSKADKSAFLDGYKGIIGRFKSGNLNDAEKNTFKINVEVYTLAILQFKIAETYPLSNIILGAAQEPNGGYKNIWPIVDAYILAENVYKTSLWLETFNPDQPNNQKKPTKVERLTLLECFEHVSKYKIVMGLLAEKGYCDSNTLVWVDFKIGHKGIIVELIKHLHTQGFYDKNTKLSNEEIQIIAKNTFGVDIGIDTIKHSTNRNRFDFIKPASTYPINPDNP